MARPAQPPRSRSAARDATSQRRVRRDRRGRGLRSRLLPPALPAANTRSESFDLVVLEAFAEIDARWHEQLGDLDLAVDDIPRVLPRDPETVQWPDEVTADGAVPLARLLPAGIDDDGRPTRARIVVFRRPLETRADSGAELLDLVHEVLVHQVATHLGLDEDTIDPDPG